MVDYNRLKRAIPASQYVVRRYKNIALRVVENVPLKDWKKVTHENSKWSRQAGMIMRKARSKESISQRFARSLGIR